MVKGKMLYPRCGVEPVPEYERAVRRVRASNDRAGLPLRENWPCRPERFRK